MAESKASFKSWFLAQKLFAVQIVQAITAAHDYAEKHFYADEWIDPMSMKLPELVDYLLEHGFKFIDFPTDGKYWIENE